VTKVSLIKDNLYLCLGIFSPVIFCLYGNLSIVLVALYYGFNLNSRINGVRKKLKYTIISFILIIPVIFLLSLTSKLILFEFPEQAKVLEMKINIYKNLTTNFISIVIVAPMLEEIIFRGLFYRAIKKFIPFVQAALISSLIFSIIHQNILSLIVLFMLSLFLTWIYEKTKSILFPIIVHSIFNLLMLSLILLENHA